MHKRTKHSLYIPISNIKRMFYGHINKLPCIRKNDSTAIKHVKEEKIND